MEYVKNFHLDAIFIIVQQARKSSPSKMVCCISRERKKENIKRTCANYYCTEAQNVQFLGMEGPQSSL